MKLREYEAKNVMKEAGIPVPAGFLIRSAEELIPHLGALGDAFVLKAQVDVGGRGKAGGILMAGPADGTRVAQQLFQKQIKGLPVKEILAEQKLDIQHEYYLSITVDRSSRQPLILFTDAGGVDIEITAQEHPELIRKAIANPLMRDVPPFMLRELIGTAPKEIGPVINKLYHLFLEKDALLAEINPLVTTPKGVFAADAKLIVDDNALGRQGFAVNRDLTDREREAEKYGFSYVELEGTIGVIGNGAGLTMSTLDLIGFYGGKAANFLDVGGGAGSERVMQAVRLAGSVPSVKVIVVNLLGGITKCDEVAKGIIAADVPQKVIVRLAGTNEAEGRAMLAAKGYEMLDTMDLVVRKAVEVAA
jgi:succinyl-CoA synthetase beta subunit